MIFKKVEDVEKVKVEKAPYNGVENEVTGVYVQWLSKSGQDSEGSPTYGLRLFTIEPQGEIPIHNHGYSQTMYFLSGEFECYSYDPDTDELIDKKVCGPGDSVYIPGMAPHGMKNIGPDDGQFLCCICTLDSCVCV